MQTRTIGSIIAATLLVLVPSGCRNLPRGGLGAGLGRGPEIRTIAGAGGRPDRLATRDQPPSTISSRVDPSPDAERPGEVTGQVVDDRGVPVANARVRLAVDGAPGGREVEGTTNRSGKFLLKGLRPGERYTLIAEWENGQDQLLGRSSISVPSEEVRIRVASVAGASDRAEVTSVTRDESSGIALFSKDVRSLESAPTPVDPPFESPATSAPDPESSRRSRVGSAGEGRAGWTPVDAVRRASLEAEPVDRSREVRAGGWPEPEPSMITDGSGRSGGGGESRRQSQQAVEPFPGNLPQPILDEPDAPQLSSSEVAKRGASQTEEGPLPLRPVPRQDDAGVAREPRPVASGDVPPIWRFEPASERESERPDPPLLMTDDPPNMEEAADPSTTDVIAESPSSPGAMQLAPMPMPMPQPEMEPEQVLVPEIEPEPQPDIAPESRSEIEPEPMSEPEVVSDSQEDPVPQPVPSTTPGSAPLPADPWESEPQERDEASGDVAPLDPLPMPMPMPDDEGSDPEISPAEPLPPDADDPGQDLTQQSARPIEEPGTVEPGQGFRWGELPPPSRLDSQVVAEDGSTEPEGADRGGPGRWAAHLWKLVRRDQEPSQSDPQVEPVVRFDAERNLLGDFTLPDLNGKPFRLSDADSDYILLCFWGTWCDPCLAAMPHLADLQQQFGPDRLRVVSIAYEREGEGGPKSVARTVRRLGLNYPVLLAAGDGSCPVASAMEVQYYPTLVLLDREGRVVHRETGATGESLMRLDRAIASAMDEGVMTVTKR